MEITPIYYSLEHSFSKTFIKEEQTNIFSKNTDVLPSTQTNTNQINVNDITKLASIILTGEEYTEVADANADGIINVNDITTIAKMILQ